MEEYEFDPKSIKKGEYSTTHKARRKVDGKIFCMKISTKKLDDDVKDFETEVQILQQINHPNIIQYYTSFWNDNKFCIVMEYADGGRLNQFVRINLTEQEIIQILLQILNGLAYLHSKNIIHRDIKPDNILLMKNGQVKISDFGSAKLLENSLDLVDSFTGTPLFMSPEQYQSQPYGKSCDIWSLGILIYLLAMQKMPFAAIRLKEMKTLVLNSEPPPIDNRFTQNFQNLIFLMLTKDPQQRPSAEFLLTFIQEIFSSIKNIQVQLSNDIPATQVESRLLEYELDPFPLDFAAFGVVFKANRKKDNKVFCLKMSKDVYADYQRIQLEQESKIMENANHPNIIQFIESFWNDFKYCIVLELAECGNLYQNLPANMSEQDILIILYQILKGLQHLHGKNIIHREINLENILLMKNGQIKMGDFGSSSIENSILTQLNFPGTPEYIAPEVYLNQPRDKPSDIWSVGIITYFLVTRCLPFYGTTQEEVKQLVLQIDPAPITSQFTIDFKKIVFSMLCKSPENRPSASQLLSFIHQHFPSITNPHIQLSFQSSLISFEYQFSNQIHGYILEINPLGFGSFGATYKATLMLDNKDFCMKITKDVFLDSERQKYIQESKLLVNVYHPNIIRYYQSFWNLQKFYIVMELVDGGNLAEILKQNSSEEEILIILFQILQGLKHLHDNNIVHRNIKPENILVMKSGQIKIADFGFAKIIESTMISHLTFAGTPQYIAPEFYLNQLRDKPSDIWSVGIITYHLATQHLPFIGKTSMEIQNLIIHSDPDPIRNHFSNAFKDMVSSMLIKSPKFRPSVDQILSVLKEHFSSIPFPQIESPSQFDLNPPVDFNRFPTTIPDQQQAQVNILNVLHQIPETVTGQ